MYIMYADKYYLNTINTPINGVHTIRDGVRIDSPYILRAVESTTAEF